MDYPFTQEQISLLNLARTVWRRRGSAIRRALSFGEESLTETILMDLAENFPGSITILPFNKRQEGKTGADWAWVFENADASRNLPMLVQAKVLDDQELEYREINRYVGRKRNGQRQIDLLISNAEQRGWPALYAFYNHLTDKSRLPDRCGTLGSSQTMPECWGVSIADPYRVRASLNDQKFDTHSLHSQPLHCLLCSGATGQRGKWGSPGLALSAIQRLRGTDVDISAARPTAIDLSDLPDEPFVELPNIFKLAKEIAAVQKPQQREKLRRSLAKDFPTLRGVVILRDAASDS